MNVKSVIKSILRRYGYDFVRYSAHVSRPFPILPMIVREQMNECDTYFFVQIGAHDGVMDDPIRDVVLSNNLPGLLIEPLPDKFIQLKDNYRTQKNLLFENVAICEKEERVTLYRVKSDAPIPQIYFGMASMDKRNLINENVPTQFIEKCEVKGVRLSFLFEKYGIKHIDLLVTDTEGYDDQIVKSTLNSGFFPDVIQFEHVHLTSSKRINIKNQLAIQGYHFLEIGKDTIAVTQNVLEKIT